MSISSNEKFRSLSAAEFFYRNKEIAGFSNPVRAIYQAVRELVENALDAADSHGILPVIKVSIDSDVMPERPDVYLVSVEDNGIGIPPDNVPQAFAQLLYSSKYVLRQTRGMFGLGAKMAVLYGQLTTGKPVEVISSTINSSRIYAFRLLIDIKENKPIILYRASFRKESDWHGTIVKLFIEGDWNRAKPKIYEYLKRTAIIAPYASIIFKDPSNNLIYFERSTTLMPKPPREVKPHPQGVDIELFKMLIQSTNTKTLKDFLIREFQGIGEITANTITEIVKIDPLKDPKNLTNEEIETLVKTLKEYNNFKPPRADHLSYLGEEIIKTGLKSILKPEFVAARTRKAKVYEGHPFIVEAGIAYGGDIPPSEEPLLLRFANKIPLLYDESSDVVWKVIEPKNGIIKWDVYEVKWPAPLVILVHICSTKVPYKGVGKESIADVPEVEKEVESCIRDVARELKLYIVKRRREVEEIEKAINIIKYIPDVATSLARITNETSHESISELLMGLILKKFKNIKVKGVNDVVLSVE
ncbi:MAG: DNA topoisomerase VI subunit B [Sulfolobales archaeon]